MDTVFGACTFLRSIHVRVITPENKAKIRKRSVIFLIAKPNGAILVSLSFGKISSIPKRRIRVSVIWTMKGWIMDTNIGEIPSECVRFRTFTEWVILPSDQSYWDKIDKAFPRSDKFHRP